MSRRHRSLSALAAVVLIALAATGCGSSSAEEEAANPPDYAKLLADSPPPLAKLYAQGNELLGGGLEAYERRIASLRGYPVVANAWASWCGSCRAEFAILQRATAKFGERVAFLGIDSQDADEAAASFLHDHPLPYPSYTDPDEEITDTLGSLRGLPDTAFYDSSGELVYVKQGSYRDDSELEADIRAHALAEGG